MKLIAQNFKGNYRQILLGPLFKLLEAVLELFVPLVMASIIDVGVVNRDVHYVLTRGLLLLLLAVLGGAAGITCQYFAAVAGKQFGRRLRGRLFRHVMKLSGSEVAAIGEGRLITRMTNDANQIQAGLNMAIRLGTRAPFLAIGSVVMALALNFRVGLIFLFTTPLIVLVLFIIMRRTVPSYGRIQAGQDELAELAGENLAGARVIRAFSRQKKQKKEFDQAAGGLTNLIVKVGKISALLNPLTFFIVNVAVIFIVWAGAQYVFDGAMMPGEIIALVSYMSQTLLALVVAANLIVIFTRALASTRRVAAVLAIQPSVVDGEGRPGGGAGRETAPRGLAGDAPAKAGAAGKGLENAKGGQGQETAFAGADEGRKGQKGAAIVPAIEFRDVHFAYNKGSEDTLEGLSFCIWPGQTAGIIGGTGSGKSTLVNLILREYDVQEGQVLVDGEDVRRYALRRLRGRMGLVPQRAALFSGSVRHNLQMGGQSAGDDELWRALRTAQGEGFVKKMPEGLDTRIEEGGRNLSGGQRQRLTIARALVRQPEILILDDAASALDFATDAAVRRALQETRAGKTTILISQRAASIRHADVVLVLDDGHLAGMGTHAQLYRENEVYREICASQGMGEEGPLEQGGAPRAASGGMQVEKNELAEGSKQSSEQASGAAGNPKIEHTSIV